MRSKKHLSFTSLRKRLSSAFHAVSDHRQSSKNEYRLHDALMSGFACMYFQDPSLLQFQKRLEKKHHKSNLQTMFDVNDIPESTQLRAIVDEVDSELFAPFFEDYFYRLQRGKHLEAYQLLPNLYLCPMDGTQIFSSTSVECVGCLSQRHEGSRWKKKRTKGKIDATITEVDEKKTPVLTYSHKILQLALMHPDQRQVIPLMPEMIQNEDGTEKQDCECNAAKRAIPKLRKTHPQLGIILGGDDLFSRQPMIEEALAARMHYLFVAKPDSHTYLMEWLSTYPKLNELEDEEDKGVIHQYSWMNKVPLHGGEKAPDVNYFSYKMLKQDEKGKQKIVYQNSWVTDLEVTEKTVGTLVKGGRCRWKIENECFNSLKNQGYCIEHNYGHGKKNLCTNFYLLTLVAFAFHQVFELTDKVYQACRKHFGSKRHLWENLRAILRIFVLSSWEFLLEFALNPENYTLSELNST